MKCYTMRSSDIKQVLSTLERKMAPFMDGTEIVNILENTQDRVIQTITNSGVTYKISVTTDKNNQYLLSIHEVGDTATA